MRHVLHDKAIVRKQVERIDGGTKACSNGSTTKANCLKVLVVEVSFDWILIACIPTGACRCDR
jgi:hypothetical protein